MQDYADVCCTLYDRLDDDIARQDGRAWLADKGMRSRSDRVAEDIEHGRTRPGRVYTQGANAGDPAGVFVVVRGLDTALRWVNPRLRGAGRTPRELLDLEDRVLRTGLLNTPASDGALMPRLAQRGEPGPPTHKRDLLTYVQRVPPDSWAHVDLRLLGRSLRLPAHDLRAGLDVACVPVVADPAELAFETCDTPAGRAYRIAPHDLVATQSRILTSSPRCTRPARSSRSRPN